MCWNAEVSLQSFLIGLAAIGIGALKGKSIALLFFCATIVFMQLVEYVVWSNYENKDINRLASISASGLLFLQPIASILAFQSPAPFLAAYIGLSALTALLGEKPDFSMTRAANGHLAWNWLAPEKMNVLTLAVYFTFLFLPILLEGATSLLAISLATLGLSLYSYWKENTWGSMWCWIVNGLVVAVVLL